MIAENNEILTSATESLYKFNSDWLIRERCRAHEDYERHELFTKLVKERQTATLAEKDAALAKKDSTIQALLEENEHLKAELAAKSNQPFIPASQKGWWVSLHTKRLTTK